LIDPADQAAAGAPWRLLVDSASDGAWNMAVDEAILEEYEKDSPWRPPTLRLYSWRPAALSLGRSQRANQLRDPSALADQGIDLVRRPTGGDAVLHEFERTYAVIGRLGVPPFTGGAVATYRAVATALASGLERFGVASRPVEPRRGEAQRGEGRAALAACFERAGAWEIEATGRKLVGSAQARRRRAFLQHGSIPFRLDPARLAAVLGAPVDASRFTDLESASGGAVDTAALDEALVFGFEAAFSVRLEARSLTDGEALRAAELRSWKYDSIAWTRDGRVGDRESLWGPAGLR
jgi:lipoate-protein ligase A